jgi:hypothetical protein
MPNNGIFGNSPDGDMGSNSGQYFIIGRVTNIVLGEFFDDGITKNPSWTSPADLGKIDFEILYTGLSVKKTNKVSKSAFPIFSFLRQYPLIGEIVYIVSGPSDSLNDNFRNQKLFYYPPFSLWNAVNHNAFPNMDQYANYVSNFSEKPGYEGSTDAEKAKLPLGNYFIENDKVKTLKPFEGDTIIESRFGQSIRFGSSNFFRGENDTWSIGSPTDVANIGKPITIITNGQGRPSANNADLFSTTVEDVSRDDSSIYLTSGQILRTLTVSDIKSSSVYAFPFSGNQALITSDRVMLYSKKEHVLLYSRKNVGLAAIQDVTVDGKQVIVTSDKILLGDAFATESAMKGEIFTIQLVRMLENLLAAGDYLKGASSTNPGAAAQNMNIAGNLIVESVRTMINFLGNRYHLSKNVMIK